MMILDFSHCRLVTAIGKEVAKNDFEIVESRNNSGALLHLPKNDLKLDLLAAH